MGCIVPAALALVHGDVGIGVDGELAVGVDGDAEEAGVRVDQTAVVALLEVVKNRGLVQVGELRHVGELVELLGVDGAGLVLGKREHLCGG